jgi:DNA-binding CsgD family transcriptional regulator
LSSVEAGPLDKLQRARADLLRAQVAFTINRGGDAAALLLKAAKQLEPLDVRLARETYLDALAAAMFAGPFATDGSVREVGESARAAPPPSRPPRAADLLLDGLAVRFTDGYEAGVPVLKRALRAFRDPDLTREEGLRWLWLAHVSAVDVWDDGWDVLAARHLELARDAGALGELPLALSMYIGAHVFVGELALAEALVGELQVVTEATGSHVAPYGALLLVAWRGREAEATRLIEPAMKEVARRGEGIGLAFIGWVKAVLLNGLGRYEDALAVAEQATEYPQEMGAPTWGALVELIEAATRGGRAERARNALQRLTRLTGASGTDWARGLEARSCALLSHGEAAESAYREAIERLGRTRIRGELARAHLLYGEWLRRQRRQTDAREQLRTAHEMFTASGAEAFAQRAARELRATGQTVRKRTTDTGGELTAQEAQIARLVREGFSNPEIAARLFLSPRTIEWHLSKIFGKLNITSRRQLVQ